MSQGSKPIGRVRRDGIVAVTAGQREAQSNGGRETPAVVAHTPIYGESGGANRSAVVRRGGKVGVAAKQREAQSNGGRETPAVVAHTPIYGESRGASRSAAFAVAALSPWQKDERKHGDSKGTKPHGFCASTVPSDAHKTRIYRLLARLLATFYIFLHIGSIALYLVTLNGHILKPKPIPKPRFFQKPSPKPNRPPKVKTVTTLLNFRVVVNATFQKYSERKVAALPLPVTSPTFT